MSDEVKYQVGKEIHDKITANSQFKAQLDSSEISSEDMIATAQDLLAESNKQCHKCQTNYSELRETDTQLYVVWEQPLSSFDRVEEALHTENMKLLCGECVESKEEEDVVGSVSTKTELSDELANSLSSTQRLFKQYTPTIFIKQNYLKLLFIYLLGLSSMFIYRFIYVNDSLTASAISSFLTPFTAMYQLITAYPPLYFLVLLPVVTIIYTLFEYYYPLQKFTTDYLNPREKSIYIYVSGGLLVTSVIHGYLLITRQQPSLVLVLSLGIILGSMYLSKVLLSLVDSDKLDLMQRDLEQRSKELADQLGNTKQEIDGSTKYIINTETYDTVIEKSLDQNNYLYGLTEVNATAIKSVAVYNILLHLSIIFLSVLGTVETLGFAWVLVLYYFPPLTLVLYLIYRKILFEVFTDTEIDT